jgi:conjugative relaxase-like TrwC/TraI family protein
MKPVASGKRAEQYYARTDGGYYHEASGLRTEWGGKGAALLGLEGTPEFEQFKRLVHGLDPHTGEQLTAKLIDNRIPGWDVTASVPKGVTVALERGDSRIQDAIWQAGREAMAMLETYATTRVRVGGQQADRNTGNLAWYAVEHPETRPVEDESLPGDHPWRVMPDMDRHIHFFVSNLTFDAEEDKWKAVKFRPIMDLRRFFDRSFESLLSKKMADLGYGIETKWKRDERGTRYFTWDIQGIPDSVIEKNSRRTAEVDATEAAIVEKIREEHGDSAPDHLSAVARDQLGATSRRQKREDLTLEECRKYWDSRFTEAEKQAVAATIRRAEGGLNARPVNTAEQAVAFSMRHHFERESCLRLEELMATAMERSLGAATPADIERELKRQGVILVERDGERLATTEAVRAEEETIATFAALGRGSVAPIGVADTLVRGQLNQGQWDAVIGMLESENRICMLEGPAGAGKSSLLKKFDDGARMAGQSITWLGTTATSVKVLREDGMDAKTLAHFLLDAKAQEAAKGGRVVVDEASMVSHADAVKLMDVARRNNLKLLVVGDQRQHGSIGRGAFMRLLKDFGHVRAFQLTEIMRQEGPEYRAAANLLYEGKSAEGFDALDQLGWVNEIADDSERVREMASEYVAASQELNHLPPQARVLAVSPTHAEANRITEEIRSQFRANGTLAADEREFSKLVPVMLSEAERGDARTYQPGEPLVLQFHQNAKGFKKGDRLVVTDPKAVPLAEAARFSVYRPEAMGLSEGDVIRFTATVRTLDGKHGLRNGDTHTVTGFDARGNLVLENGWVVDQDAGHFRHGYVETSMGSQGRTVKRVLLGMSSASLPATNMEQMYVSATRAKQKLSLYTDAREEVRDAIQRSSQKRLALDILPPKPEAEKPKRRQQQLAHTRRRTFFEAMRAAWNAARPRLARHAPRDASREASRQNPMPGMPPTHAERFRARQQERELGHER